MTSTATLKRLLSDAETLLIDFDGPICSVFSGVPSAVVAEKLRSTVKRFSEHRLPTAVAQTGDPFVVFLYAAGLGAEAAQATESELSVLENESIARAEPTVGSYELLKKWHRSGRKAAIVSNNGQSAVNRYIEKADIRGFVDYISARTSFDPSLLKPNPYLVERAVQKLSSTPDKAVLIGDSPSDIAAAKRCGVTSIGYANRPAKLEKLSHAQVVVSCLGSVVEALGYTSD
ncbi:HAD family hydrolase [Saccharothrix saharensis]|uniref:HAD family hydrolase n=1 Tax=Saccharothrix saharensis TaxID=571190 RepID=UPI00368F1A2A